MVVPFVYADKSSLFHEIFFHERVTKLSDSSNLAKCQDVLISFFFILLLSTKRVDCANNCVYSRMSIAPIVGREVAKFPSIETR